MLDVRRMRVLAAVADHGSFSAAAEALHMTQSAVSQQVAALEREVGEPLLVRARGGVRPTQAGQVICDAHSAVAARLEAAREEVEAIAGLRGGRLRMAAFPSAGAVLVPDAVRRFRAAHPDVELTMVQGEPSQTIPSLAAGDLDLALTFDYPGVELSYDAPGTERELLLAEPVLVAVPAEHPLAEAEAVALSDLAGESLLSGQAGGPCQAIALHACRAAGFEPKVSFESDDDPTLLGLVAAGIGFALMPRLCLLNMPDGVAVRPPADPIPERRVWAQTPASPERIPAAEAMVGILAELAAPMGDRDTAPA